MNLVNLIPVLGSARDSRAGDGDLAIANFLRGKTAAVTPQTLFKFVAASRRDQHASRVRSPDFTRPPRHK
jgi:hypothetical protein